MSCKIHLHEDVLGTHKQLVTWLRTSFLKGKVSMELLLLSKLCAHSKSYFLHDYISQTQVRKGKPTSWTCISLRYKMITRGVFTLPIANTSWNADIKIQVLANVPPKYCNVHYKFLKTPYSHSHNSNAAVLPLLLWHVSEVSSYEILILLTSTEPS